MIILKVTRKQNFTLSLENTFFEKPEGDQIDIKFTRPNSTRSILVTCWQLMFYQKCVLIKTVSLESGAQDRNGRGAC